MYCVKSVGGTFNDIFLPPAFVLLQQVHNELDWSSLMDLQDSFSVLCLLFLAHTVLDIHQHTKQKEFLNTMMRF